MPPKAIRPPNRGRRAMPVTLSAPTGGLNGRDSLTEMPIKDAFVLDNWFPGLTSVDTRKGSLTKVTGIPGPVESLETFTGIGAPKLLAFGDGKVYDATTPGVIGAALLSSRVSNRVTSTMFSNAGAQFLLIYSGADAPLSYSGTALTALTITGLNSGTTQDQLFCGMGFKGRMLLGQLTQLGFYYLAVGAIQGAASYFDLSQQCVRGGTLAAICSWSQDTEGVGPEDYCIFVTTEGEYIMYVGTDPSNAAVWALVGRYYGPAPIGPKGHFNFRSDVYFITVEGILSLTQIRQMGDEQDDKRYLTSKLGRAYTDLVNDDTVHGWCGVVYPLGKYLMVNVPLTGSIAGGYAQFLMNTTSNAWGRQIALDGICWVMFNKRLYFGTNDGRVVLADEGFTDDGTQIQAVSRQAWNTFDDQNGMGDADKQFHFATFAVQSEGTPAVSASLNTNYEDDQPTYSVAIPTPDGAAWDVTDWDTSFWAGVSSTQNLTIPVGKIGYIASLWMQASSVSSTLRWFATRIILEKTKGILLQ